MEILKVDDNLRKIERKTKKVRTQKTVIKKDVKKPSITEKKIKRFEKSIETRSLEFPNLKISKPIKNVNITTKVVIIGASVGGPKSLRTVLEQFPSDINCPILIVQHLNKKFVDVLAESLESTCALKVKVAENNEYIKPGIVYLSPGEKHMEISIKNKKPCIRLYFGEPVHHCIPSIDVLFKSAAKIYQNQALGILLTGMGEDGVEGLGIIKSFNGITIAESEETSILYGMPKSAARRGLADYIMPNYDIPKLIIKYLKE